MRRFYAGITFVVSMVLVVLVTHHLLGHLPGQFKPSDPTVSNQIVTAKPSHMTFSDNLWFSGQVRCKYAVNIIALRPGRVISILVQDGSEVKKGMPLFNLGGPTMNAKLVSLKERISSLEKRLKISKDRLRRKQQAFRDGISTKDELDAAMATKAKVESDLANARSELSSLSAASMVTSPMDGVFTERRVSPGQDVEKGTILARVIDPTRMLVVARLFPPHRARLNGKSADIYADGRVIKGVLTRVLPERVSTGASVAWIVSRDIDRYLKPGEIVNGVLFLSEHRSSLAVPEDAVMHDVDGNAYVFVENGTNSYTKRKVKEGLSSKGWVEIVSGLKDKDNVVVKGAYELFYKDFNRVYKVPD